MIRKILLGFTLAFGITAAAAQSLAPIGPSGSAGGGGAPSGAAGGGLGGTYPNPTVTTNANLTGDVTSVGNATTYTNSIPTTKMPADTGDVTRPAGSSVTTYSNVVPAAKGGAGTITGALKGNGSGVVSQAACADLNNAGTACSAPIMQTKIITATRDLTASSGSVSYTGMGFAPTSCNTMGYVSDGTSYVSLNGMSDTAKNSSTVASYGSAATLTIGNNVLFYFIDSTGGNKQSAGIASYDADGLTLSWTKTGTPTGTANLWIRCQR